MFNNKQKIIYYDVLNGIQTDFLKIKEPFDIITSNIKMTHKDVHLHYIKDKNYFTVIEKSHNKKPGNHNQNNKHDREHSPKREFTAEEHAAYLERKKRRDNSPKREFTAEEHAAYLERKKRRENGEHSPKREFTAEEHAAYLERKKRRESGEHSPKREFTAEEHAAYLERKKRRESSQEKQQEKQQEKNIIKGGATKILVYF